MVKHANSELEKMFWLEIVFVISASLPESMM